MTTTGRRPDAGAGRVAAGRSLVPIEPALAGNSHSRPHGRLLHQSAAFLAHLALQYDGIAARRRARWEKLEAAISSYGDAGGKMLLNRSSLNLKL